MSRPDIKLFNIPLAFAMFASTACADSRPPVNAGQTPEKEAIATITAKETVLITEKRRMGKTLENLDFSIPEKGKMRTGIPYPFGRFVFILSEENFEVAFNSRELSAIAENCNIKSFQKPLFVEISDQELTETFIFSPMGDGIVMGIEPSYENIDKQLDDNFEVAPDKRIKALDNLAIILFNMSLLKNICTVSLADKPDYAVRMQRLPQDTLRYRDQLFQNMIAPVVIFRPAPRIFRKLGQQ